MNMRISFILITLFFFSGFATADWSIPDPNDKSKPATGEYLKSIESQGYWQFEYDPTNPISAAMYCCWWEMVYGNQKKYFDAMNGVTSTESDSSSDSSIETKSYCPACHIDDSFATLEVEPELQSLSDELMQTKPWLKEGKDKNPVRKVNNTTTAVLSFSEPVKI
ncbi:hypothetical protein KSK55_16060 [Methanospirillum purgamenti]|jgi:hypothetical protein|uniref:Uncharacterized protein n=1 Tax=Methanospirillum hungatei TaxID=2203 RepID=A0A8F5VMF3_METHU|nr:hypothetical protein [Methanospirillum hungatei]QXO94796.1 hypothetical protein KSK55_16060 [Methanospirillum hungatei]